MKKIVGIVFFCLCILLLYSCNKCKQDAITKDERVFINYEVGDKTFFKNDSSGLTETLIARTKDEQKYCQDCGCKNTSIGIRSTLTFSPNNGRGFAIRISHNQSLWVSIDYINPNAPQTITIGSKTYNDVYSVSIDSSNINYTIPWKIEYSKSNGIVRIHYLKGTTFTRI